jgi:hypothetical protein
MNCCRETAKMGVPARHRERSGEAGGPPGNRMVSVFVPKRYVAGGDTRGRQEGRPYPWSQQVIHEISGLDIFPVSHRLNQ